MSVVIYVGIAATVVVALSIVLPAFVGGAWSPTTMARVRAMIRIAELQPDELLYDLGAGDGRIIITAAREFGARAVGVEVDPLRAVLCRLRVRYARLQKRVFVERANFFAIDLREADVITFYLSQAAASKLQHKFVTELKVGTRIVSHGRPLPQWQPTAVDEEHRLYVYIVEAADASRG